MAREHRLVIYGNWRYSMVATVEESNCHTVVAYYTSVFIVRTMRKFDNDYRYGSTST